MFISRIIWGGATSETGTLYETGRWNKQESRLAVGRRHEVEVAVVVVVEVRLKLKLRLMVRTCDFPFQFFNLFSTTAVLK